MDPRLYVTLRDDVFETSEIFYLYRALAGSDI